MSGNIQSHFSVSQWREGTSGGQRSRMLPNILQLKGPSPWQRITCSQMSTVPRLRETNTGSKEQEPRKSATCNKHVKLFHMENTYQASSIHSFNRHYLCVTSTSGPVLGTEDTAMSQTKKVSAQHGVSHQWQMCSKTVSAPKNSRLQTDALCISTLRSLLGLPRGFSAAKAAGKRK